MLLGMVAHHGPGAPNQRRSNVRAVPQIIAIRSIKTNILAIKTIIADMYRGGIKSTPPLVFRAQNKTKEQLAADMVASCLNSFKTRGYLRVLLFSAVAC